MSFLLTYHPCQLLMDLTSMSACRQMLMSSGSSISSWCAPAKWQI